MTQEKTVRLAVVARKLVRELGTAGAVAERAGLTRRTVERALAGDGDHVGDTTLERLEAVAAGQTFDAARASRVEEYRRRAEAGLPIFD